MASRQLRLTGRIVGALASPLRQDILMVLENSACLSVAEIARRIGRRPDTLYHHLKALRSAGLVREKKRALTGGRPGGFWCLTVEQVTAKPVRGGRTRAADAERVVGVLMRSGLRDYQQALRRFLSGQARRPRAFRSVGWLTPSEHARFERDFDALFEALRSSEPGAGRKPYTLTGLFTPAPSPAPGPSEKGRPRRRGARSPR